MTSRADLGKELFYGAAEVAASAVMLSTSAVEASAQVCSSLNPAEGTLLARTCSAAQTLGALPLAPESPLYMVPYVGTALALGSHGVYRIGKVMNVGLQGAREDAKKAWKTFKEQVQKGNLKVPCGGLGALGGLVLSGLTTTPIIAGLGLYVAADLYYDYVRAPSLPKKKDDSLLKGTATKVSFQPPVDGSEDGDEAFIPSLESLAYSDYADQSFSAYQTHSAPTANSPRRSSIPDVNFVGAQTPAAGKIKMQIRGKTYLFNNVWSAFLAVQYPAHAQNFVNTTDQQADAYAAKLIQQKVRPSPLANTAKMYHILGLRLAGDAKAREELRAMTDDEIDAVEPQSIQPILRHIRDWEIDRHSQGKVKVDASYPEKVRQLAHRQGAQ